MSKTDDRDVPRLIEGGLSVDDRGQVAFCNGFDFAGVKRMYSVRNYRAGLVRAWHAHKREAKWVTVVKGAALVGLVKVDSFVNPSPDLVPQRYVLSEAKPAVLYVPPGWANGTMVLAESAGGTVIVFFSSSTVEESKDDDYRYPARLWDCWEVAER